MTEDIQDTVVKSCTILTWLELTLTVSLTVYGLLSNLVILILDIRGHTE